MVIQMNNATNYNKIDYHVREILSDCKSIEQLNGIQATLQIHINKLTREKRNELIPPTKFDWLVSHGVDEMAAFIHGIIKEVNAQHDKKLKEAGIDFTRIDVSDDLQIQIYKNILLKEAGEQ